MLLSGRNLLFLVLSRRYKVHEEKLFIEKESLKSQLEAAQEEKAKLLKVY